MSRRAGPSLEQAQTSNQSAGTLGTRVPVGALEGFERRSEPLHVQSPICLCSLLLQLPGRDFTVVMCQILWHKDFAEFNRLFLCLPHLFSPKILGEAVLPPLP